MTDPNPSSALDVLLVDDDPISLALLDNDLRGAGHRVHTVHDARAAMAVLERQTIQIVIADWVMPGMSGLELCRWVRSRRLPGALHFVMLTMWCDREHMIEAFEAGVDDFLGKPLQRAELLARLRAWTRFVRLQEELAARNASAEGLNRELSAANARLADLAVRDELTGLQNRRAAMRRLDEQWEVFRRYGTAFSCALVDVDRFKRINDAHGHAAGDRALCQIGQALASGVRAADGLYRFGGDEFLILFPAGDRADALACAARCRDLVATNPIALPTADLACTVSIGVATATPETHSPADLLQAADLALYSAKGAGRNASEMELEELAPARRPS